MKLTARTKKPTMLGVDDNLSSLSPSICYMEILSFECYNVDNKIKKENKENNHSLSGGGGVDNSIDSIAHQPYNSKK